MRIPTKWVVLPLLIVAILIWVAALTASDNRLHVFFLDVGQGDAMLIRTPSHQNILIDGGPSPEAISLELGKRLPFWDRSIDLVVLTQPHADHVAGLIEVLRRYQVKEVLEPGVEYDSATYREWQSLIEEKVEEKVIESTIARAGQRIDLSPGIWLEVLHPQETPLEGTSSDIDNNGIVLRLVWGEVSFLFTADIRGEAEHQLLAYGFELRSTVLKVAHHGSGTSTCPGFLNAVDPQVAVISVGEDNPFGHPSVEVVERLSTMELFRTDQNGTIELITDGERLWVKVEKQQSNARALCSGVMACSILILAARSIIFPAGKAYNKVSNEGEQRLC